MGVAGSLLGKGRGRNKTRSRIKKKKKPKSLQRGSQREGYFKQGQLSGTETEVSFLGCRGGGALHNWVLPEQQQTEEKKRQRMAADEQVDPVTYS